MIMVMKVQAYSPSHITGFFSIFESDDPIRTGSTGAGICLEKGIYTDVEAKPSTRNRVYIYINGSPDPAPTSSYVVRHYLKRVRDKFFIKISHMIQVPIGSGFGSSGGGALSLSYALNRLFGETYTRIEAAQIAHVAEVVNKTGLGTVIAEYYGGLEVRVEPGAPGVGRVRKYSVSRDKYVVAVNFGEILTKTILSNKIIKRRIMDRGNKYVTDFMREPNIGSFLLLSRRFAYETGLMDDLISDVCEVFIRNGFEPAMAMVGKTVFTIVDIGEVREVVKLVRDEFGIKPRVIVSHIDNDGAKIIY